MRASSPFLARRADGQHSEELLGEHASSPGRREETEMQRNPSGALVMFWIWMGTVIAGFLTMAVIVVSGR